MTDRFILIGHPVGHSLSPAIHRAAYAELRREGSYELVDAGEEQQVAAQVDRIRRGELRGANVTVPWKRLALSLADRVDESARAVGAANVLGRDGDGLVVAYNTDAPALATELTELVAAGDSSALTTACVIGNGGAALGAVLACRMAGARTIFVVARGFRPEEDPEHWPRGRELRALGAELVAWPPTASGAAQSWRDVVRQTRLFVQATSAGMRGADAGEQVAGLVPWAELSGACAYDLVYNPAETPFLRAAAAAGHRTRGGLGMLVRQAALAIQIWWGVLPPLGPLTAAAERALFPAAEPPERRP